MSQPFFLRQLTRSERAQVRKLRKRPPNLDVYRRVQAVHLSSQRLKVHRIAEIVGRSRVTVTRWLHEFGIRGLPALWPGKSPGRPPKVDAEFQASNLVVDVIVAGQENKGDMAVLGDGLDPRAELEAVYFGHLGVADDQVGGADVDLF